VLFRSPFALLACAVPVLAVAAAVKRRVSGRQSKELSGVGLGTIFRVAKQMLWKGPHRRRAARYLLLLFLALATTNGATVAQSFAQREYMSALAQGDAALFGSGLAFALALLAVSIPTRCLAEFATGGLGIAWRDALTDGLLDEYFKPQVAYWLRKEGVVKDPDARIAVEAGHFADAAVLMVRDVFENAMKLLGFIGVVYTISHQLCVVMASYAILGAFATVLVFGRPLVRLDRGIRAQEATLRSAIARCRDKAEALTFAQGEAAEGMVIKERYQDLRRRQWSRVLWRTGLASFRDCFSWAAYLLPIAFVAPLYLRGEVRFGAIAQTVTAFQASLDALSVVVRKFRSVSSLVAEGGRLDGLSEALGRAVMPQSAIAMQTVTDGEGLDVSKLSLSLPTGARLCSNLSFTLEPGQRVMISGESGVGKTTFIRSLAGLWSDGSGCVRRPASAVFLSQEPYLPEGTLRRVLSFPAVVGSFSDAEILLAAQGAQLDGVLGRFALDDVVDWEAVLSRGEQQRCTFCQALLARPALVVLDEATSALDVEREALLYEALEASCVVSVSHRIGLLESHTHLLRREEDDESGRPVWIFSPL